MKVNYRFLVLAIAASWALMGMKPGFESRYFGIFSTYQDYKDNRLTYPLDCSSKQDKLQINSFFGSGTGYVEYRGEKHRFDKNQVFGYRDCTGKDFRFFQNEAYQILEVSGITLYYKYGYEAMQKGKGMVKTDQYFFSRGADGAIVNLTTDQLKKAFADNSRFRYAIDAQFRSDHDLPAYDSFQKTHKLIYVYNQTLN